MQCSDCRRVIRPVVALDIDGTLGDYHGHFYQFCYNYFGWTFKVPPHPYDGTVEFEDYLGLTKQQYREAKLAYRQGGSKRWLPVYPGATGMVVDLAIEAEVWIATTRPWQRLDNIDPDTREWLKRNAMLDSISGLLYGDDKWTQLIDAVGKDRIVAVVDDLPELVDRAKEMGLPAILRMNDHNITVSEKYIPRGNLTVCHGWAQTRVAQWIKDRRQNA